MRNVWWRGFAGLSLFILILGLPLINTPRQSLSQNVLRRPRIELETTNVPTSRPVQPETVTITPSASTTIMEQNFEGIWPGVNWDIVDMSTGGSYTWEKRWCTAHAGMYGGSVALAPYGGVPGCASHYPDNASVAAVYGPFDLSRVSAASLTFYLTGRTEENTDSTGRPYDYMMVASSLDGTNFSVVRSYYGNLSNGPYGNGYFKEIVDLSDRIGQPNVWITFWFRSDANVNDVGITIDDIALATAEGPSPVTPTTTPAPPKSAVYLPLTTSPDLVGHVVYTHFEVGQGNALYTRRPDGSEPTLIAGCAPEGYGLTIQTCSPSWSPDGARLVFHSKFANDTSMHLYVVNVAAKHPTALTHDDLSNDAYPVWSPRGDQIAFVRNSAGDFMQAGTIYILKLSDNSLARVAADSMFLPIAWSPDGDRIIYSCREPFVKTGIDNYGLCTIKTDGTDRRILVDDPNRAEGAPAWSPNRAWIAYISAPYMLSTDPRIHIGSYRGKLMLISPDRARQETVVADKVEPRGLAWSRDSGRIVFAYRYSENFTISKERSDLFIVNVTGAHESQILSKNDIPGHDGRDYDVDPDWN